MNVWAIDQSKNEIIHVSQAKRGNACNCVCIACGQQLQARLGDERKPHFKHITNTECAPETIIHKLVKMILSRNNHFVLPDGRGYFSYERTSIEQLLQNLRPDIILHGAMDLHIEIAVTNFIREKKYNKIIAAGYPTIEINASKWHLLESYESLENAVINGRWDKEVIYWPASLEPSSSERFGNWFLALLGFFVFLFVGYLLVPANSKRKNRKRLKY